MKTTAGLSANALKMIAIVAMVIDHTAWHFAPFNTFLGFFMHVIGRLTLPIMSYFIAVGFFATRNVRKYAWRLFLIGIISQIPFMYFFTGRFSFLILDNWVDLEGSLNVMFTLLLGLLALWVCKSSLSQFAKVFLVAICCLVSFVTDWEIYGVLYVLVFGLNNGNLKKQAFWFSVASVPTIIFLPMSMHLEWYLNLFMLGVFLALPLLFWYNGKRGGYKGSKWVFYAFYPLHLLLIGFIKWGLLS